jgi:squalene-hopene/tetraprenyl-beta-curcumene cyclase
LRAVEPAFPSAVRRHAIKWSVDFVTTRLNGEDGLGAIYPAMANTVMMFDTLGRAEPRNRSGKMLSVLRSASDHS